MNWMFWKNDSQPKKLPGPKGIPDAVGRYLVTKENMSPNLVWTLMAVAIPRSDEKDVIDVRVYDSNKAAHSSVMVKNYHSLDDHPDLIIFDGWYHKVIHTVGKRKL